MSAPLDFPSKKIVLLFFAHVKGLGHVIKKSFRCSQILRRHKPNIIFGWTTRVLKDKIGI